MPNKQDRYRKRSRLEAKFHEQLRERSNQIHELEQRLMFANRPYEAQIEKLTSERDQLARDLADRTAAAQHMLLWCPECHHRHIDTVFATKPHHTHACQNCGMTWRPAIGPTIGVRYLPGFKDEPRDEVAALLERLRDLRSGIAIVGHDDRPREIVDDLVRKGSR